MATGRLREQWKQTSQILALLVNINRKKGTPPVEAYRFNPFHKTETQKPDFYINPKQLAKHVTNRSER
jgi:hypothetical protein